MSDTHGVPSIEPAGESPEVLRLRGIAKRDIHLLEDALVLNGIPQTAVDAANILREQRNQQRAAIADGTSGAFWERKKTLFARNLATLKDCSDHFPLEAWNKWNAVHADVSSGDFDADALDAFLVEILAQESLADQIVKAREGCNKINTTLDEMTHEGANVGSAKAHIATLLRLLNEEDPDTFAISAAYDLLKSDTLGVAAGADREDAPPLPPSLPRAVPPSHGGEAHEASHEHGESAEVRDTPSRIQRIKKWARRHMLKLIAGGVVATGGMEMTDSLPHPIRGPLRAVAPQTFNLNPYTYSTYPEILKEEERLKTAIKEANAQKAEDIRWRLDKLDQVKKQIEKAQNINQPGPVLDLGLGFSGQRTGEKIVITVPKDSEHGKNFAIFLGKPGSGQESKLYTKNIVKRGADQIEIELTAEQMADPSVGVVIGKPKVGLDWTEKVYGPLTVFHK